MDWGDAQYDIPPIISNPCFCLDISNHALCFLCSIETIDNETEDVREINNRMGDVEHSALTIFASTGTSGRYDSHREENMSVRKDID